MSYVSRSGVSTRDRAASRRQSTASRRRRVRVREREFIALARVQNRRLGGRRRARGVDSSVIHRRARLGRSVRGARNGPRSSRSRALRWIGERRTVWGSFPRRASAFGGLRRRVSGGGCDARAERG